jgi:hypothetical protein
LGDLTGLAQSVPISEGVRHAAFESFSKKCSILSRRRLQK